MDGVFLTKGEYFASIWKSTGGYIALLSQHKYPALPSLLHAGYWRPNGSADSFLKKLLANSFSATPLEAMAVRSNFKAADREVFSLHLLAAQSEQHRDFENIISEIAWRSVELVSWGEASVAKVLAAEYEVPTRTIHTRLRMARERKLISSPGIGDRTSSRYESNMRKILE